MILALFVVCGIFSQAQEKWKLRKDKNAIKVFSKITDQSDFEAFKAKMLVEGSIQDFVAVLKGIESLPDWAHNVKYADLLEISGDTLQMGC